MASECDCGKGEWCPEFGSAFKAAEKERTMDTITYRSRDGRTVAVEFGVYSLTTAQALAFAGELQRAASWAENADSRHERHVDLQASCPLCVFEAGGQTDRLTHDEDEEEV